MIHAALDAGINLIDTSDVYSSGESEVIVGKALRGRRDDVVLATKFCLPMGEDANFSGGSRRWIMRAVEDSLRRLGTDHLDLYQIHRPDPATDVDQTLSALSDLVHAGKVRRSARRRVPADQAKLATVRQLAELAAQAGLTLPRLATAFVLAHPAVSAVLIGPRTMTQLESSLSFAGTVLEADVLDRIDAIVAPGTELNPMDNFYTNPALTDLRLRRGELCPLLNRRLWERTWWPCLRDSRTGCRQPRRSSSGLPGQSSEADQRRWLRS